MPSLNQKNRAPDLPLLIKKSSGDLDSPTGVITSPLGIDTLPFGAVQRLAAPKRLPLNK